MIPAASSWDAEYRAKGIPSSFREQPSTTLIWALTNWELDTGRPGPTTAIDVGCGTGRNAAFLTLRGIDVVAFDFSAEAIRQGMERRDALPSDMSRRLDLRQHNLNDGLPADSSTIDLVCDIFVYKHQVETEARRRYRAEIARVLTEDGRLFLSLAEARDGYYSECPRIATADDTNERIYIHDPIADVDSVLFTMPGLTEELADQFSLTMSWMKLTRGPMHGKMYSRYTLATLWRKK